MTESHTNAVDIAVALGERSYTVKVGPGLIDEAGRHIAPLLRQKRVVVVTDETVAGLHLPRLRAALEGTGIGHQSVILPPGEHTKDFSFLQKLTGDLLEIGIERSSVLVAFGGGVIGDLAGFAAAVVLRGIDFVQVPTTLLAQVDSSVGGKTAIDMPQGKNLVGAFHQPRLVLADVDLLKTLPKREVLAGYAEVVKYGLINDPTFFEWLEANGEAVVRIDAAAARQAVATSCRAKAAVVAADEREQGDRALLNLGHTFAHALETETGYGPDLLHGEAVAVGMALAFDLSARLGLCPAADAARVRRHLRAIGLPAALADIKTPGSQQRWNIGALLAHMGRDKKVRDGKVTFILARGIGRAFQAPGIDLATVEAVLAEAAAA
jgi:3-dehydroquinate synthase